MKNKILCFLGFHSPVYSMKLLNFSFKHMYFRKQECEHCKCLIGRYDAKRTTLHIS